MSRPIRFRVWHSGKKQWVHRPGQEVNLFGETILMGEFTRHVPLEEYNDLVALQFTGLKDKNGREVYEGDLLVQHGHRDLVDMVFRVGEISTYIPLSVASFRGKRWNMSFALGEFGRLNGWQGGNEPFCEVVGNVYDNPDLLSS